ncbi:MAG: methyltransferase family protein [Exilispira sp.]
MKYNIYINIKIRIAGLIAGIFGVIIIGWASHVLDGEFSETIEIKENHRLITDGPYKHVRHPIYSGFILMHIGITIALSNLLIILFFNIGLFFLLLERIPKEEKVLKDFFGKKWEDYCEKRSMFLPFIKKLTKKI